MDISIYKHCFTCDQVYLKSTGFYANKARRDGVSVACKRCHEAEILKAERHSRQIREEIVRLLGGKCVECGYDKDIRGLQIDHLNGNRAEERKINISGNKQYAYIKANLHTGNYQVLCGTCNTIKRAEQEEYKPRKHPLPEPILGEIRDLVIAAKPKQGNQKGSKRPNQAVKLQEWRENNPDIFLARNEKISQTRTGKTYK